MVRVAVVVPDVGTPVDAKLGNRAVLGVAHDVTRRNRRRIAVSRAAHILPARGVLLIGRFRISFELSQHALAGLGSQAC
jgi:hypothetical protein